MKKIVLTVITFIITAVWISCECITPVCDFSPGFKIENKSTHNNLIFSSNPVYTLDSIYATMPGDDSTVIHFYTLDSVSISQGFYMRGKDTLYLHFNATETDTLHIHYHVGHSTFCCKSGIETITYISDNGTSLNNDNNVFSIEK